LKPLNNEFIVNVVKYVFQIYVTKQLFINSLPILLHSEFLINFIPEVKNAGIAKMITHNAIKYRHMNLTISH